MTKRLTSSLFVVLAVLASAVPASAQAIRWGYIPQTSDGWYYMIRGDQVGMLTADNLGMVRGLTNQLRRSEIRSLTDDLVWNGVAYGINTARGFLPMYDRDRRPLSGRQRIERGAGIVAAADGVRRIVNNPRGAAGWIEAAVGAVLVNDSRYRGQSNNQRDIPVAVGTRPGGSAGSSPFWGPGSSGRLNCMEQGMATLENQSTGPLRVYRDAKPYEVLLPKQQKCVPPEGDYTGEVVGMVVGSDGLTGRVGVAPAKPESRSGLVLVWR